MKFAPYVVAVYIAEHTFQWFKCFKPVCNLNGTKITGMPDFITIFKMFKDIFIQITMCVRYEADSLQ